MKTKIVLLVIGFLFILAPSLEAKWWIFGGSEEEVGFDYLYVNSLSFDDVDKEAVLPKESLDKGYLHIRGKARTGKNGVGAITVSLDGGKTWGKAKFEKDGGFDFSFEPNFTQFYDVYVKVIDTAGKSNEIDNSHIKISFTDTDYRSLIAETLNKLKGYYEREDDSGFMQYVDRNFEGDDMTLERALRKDFSALETIRIDFTLSSVAFSNNHYYASVLFNRTVTASSTGTTYSDRGITEFTFSVGEKGAMLLSMKNPLIFGLTYAADVATGTVASSQNNSQFLSINDSGTVGESSLSDIMNDTASNDYMTSGTFYLENSCTPPCNNADGFNFTNDEKTFLISDSEIYKEMNLLWGNNGAQVQNMGAVAFNGVTVPETGYNSNVNISTIGDVIAVKLPNNTYGVIKITNIAGARVYFDYKYNPNGSRIFP
ncbi:hypothetical protein [Sulfuricurvum sp.]|uniref:hypothetical protein n=1 Tax=Sulfuricurvum sp. TaxID=2025608 RepID=UPI00260767F4|nr:hypothetical protein [Sulfuricurvum sp.]MDD2781181.1 hypothetical protein [Sulfuricurvum sp.]